MKTIFLLASTFAFTTLCVAQEPTIRVPITQRKSQFEIVGELGVKLGTIVTVRGFIYEDWGKGYETGPILVIQSINDSAIQEFIKIPYSLYFEGMDDKRFPDKVKPGNTYQFRVYETGGYVGTPDGVYEETKVLTQTTALYFQNNLVVISGKKIEPAEWSPRDFIGRNAVLTGIAKNENDTAVIYTAGWTLKLTGSRKWSEAASGKQAEVYGKIRPTAENNVYAVDSGRARLVKLEDQVGKTVQLRGTIINLNQYWWFNYRGTDIYVDGLDKLVDGVSDMHFRPVEITGLLEQANMPDIDKLVLEENPPKKLYYIIRKASISPASELLTPEIPFDNNSWPASRFSRR
ncbi:MAG: hypothetical protein JNM88_02990 [Chitinophagaceae bacterium]|nr:hypothetical protein [Chitinophagaceae bacterium]